MLKIITSDLSLDSMQTRIRVDKLVLALLKWGIKPKAFIALYADLSLNGLLLSMAAIKLGLKTAFCPLREPPGVLNNWLKDLGVSALLFSGDQSLKAHFSLPLCDLNLITIKNHDSEAPRDYSREFLSFMRTSGTTKEPKTAIIDYAAHRASALAVNAYFDFDKQKTWALSLPLYHVSGLSIVFRALCADARVYIAPNHQELCLALSSGKITHCSVVPSQLKRLLSEGLDLTKLSALIVGGDRLMPKDRNRALGQAWPLFETYGMCETASMIAVKNMSEAHAGTIILPHARVILDESKEILVKGESLFLGYWQKGKIAQFLNADGFFPTGDTSAESELSQLQIICRKNNRIISGGENIQAEEIESIIEQHPLVDECVVVPKPDEDLGARPVAFIKWKNKALSHESITNFLASRCAAYKRPVLYLSYPSHMPFSFKKPRRWLCEYSAQLH